MNVIVTETINSEELGRNQCLEKITKRRRASLAARGESQECKSAVLSFLACPDVWAVHRFRIRRGHKRDLRQFNELRASCRF